MKGCLIHPLFFWHVALICLIRDLAAPPPRRLKTYIVREFRRNLKHILAFKIHIISPVGHLSQQNYGNPAFNILKLNLKEMCPKHVIYTQGTPLASSCHAYDPLRQTHPPPTSLSQRSFPGSVSKTFSRICPACTIGA